MTEFIKSALPFVLMGVSLAIFLANHSKNRKEEGEWDFSSMGPIFGVAVGIAVGTANEAIGAGLGAGIGMFAGTLIELFIKNQKQ